MEMQNVLHTERIAIGKRTYFFDLKRSEKGNDYLVITESRLVEAERYERQRLVLFQDELKQFGATLMDMMLLFKGKSKQRKLSEEEIEEIRKEYPNAFVPWTTEDDQSLMQLFQEGQSIEELASHFHRKPAAIDYRIKKLKAA
ncbi:MAG: DUF3276 family protein [Bacteroidota bacterium]